MTEYEWLASIDPGPMERYLSPTVSPRKSRLYACACCRQIWADMEDTRSRHAVEIAEGHADGLATAEQLRATNAGADEAATPYGYDVFNMAEIASSAHL